VLIRTGSRGFGQDVIPDIGFLVDLAVGLLLAFASACWRPGFCFCLLAAWLLLLPAGGLDWTWFSGTRCF
jgi:hypothetical protein